MSKQAFDRKLEALEALRHAPEVAQVTEQLRRALRDRSNYVVSKAAALAGVRGLTDLIPDLLAAWDRSFIDPLKSDPQCWAKNALAKALRDLAHRDAAVYLRGLEYTQLEPVWGGRADSAITLRGTCALALVACPMDDLEILSRLSTALADPETPVRIDAATAIAQVGRAEGSLLLRLKALLGDSEPQVTGECFAALLSLEPERSIEFIARFLKPDKDAEATTIEAAGALAQSQQPEAMDRIEAFWGSLLSHDVRRAIVASLGASPLPKSAELLLRILEQQSGELAESAVAAMASSRFRTAVRERTASLVDSRADSSLTRVFQRTWLGAGQ